MYSVTVYFFLLKLASAYRNDHCNVPYVCIVSCAGESGYFSERELITICILTTGKITNCIYVWHPYKRVHMLQKLKKEIFLDLNSAGHDKSVEKKLTF